MLKKTWVFFPKTDPKEIVSTFDNKYIEYKNQGDEHLLIKEYIERIRPYLHDLFEALLWKFFVTELSFHNMIFGE